MNTSTSTKIHSPTQLLQETIMNLRRSTIFALLLCMAILLAGGVSAFAFGLPDPYQQPDELSVDTAPIAESEATSPATAQAIAAGGSHTCAVTSSGGVKCWGFNGLGELGDGTTTNRLTPVDVSGLDRVVVKSVVAGGGHTCVLTTAGDVKCWGRNFEGQLGNGTTTNSLTPVDVIGLGSGVKAIVAGEWYNCVVTANGGVKCWGNNYYGQLGNGETAYSQSTPVNVIGLESGVTALVAGMGHTCAVMTDRRAKCWGLNAFGQLGDGTTDDSSVPLDVIGLWSDEVYSLAAGIHHTCATNPYWPPGQLWCWGFNSMGQLGDGTTDDSSVPVRVKVLGAYGTSWAVVAGNFHTCGQRFFGDELLRCWGQNSFGQLGDGTGRDSLIPVFVSGLRSGALSAFDDHTCAVTASGGVKCWGDNYHGQLGDGTTTNRLTPVDVVGFPGCYTLMKNVNPTNSGSVSANPAPNCNGGTQYTSGTLVTLAANANGSYRFSSWSGDASGTANPTTVTMTGNKTITANFNYCNNLTINVNPPGSGSVSASPPANICFSGGQPVTLTANPNSGYSFSHWSGDASGTANPLTYTMTGNRTITANFSGSPPCNNRLTVNVSPTNGGSVSGVIAPPYCYSLGQPATLTANPASGYRFSHWSGDASGSANPLTITMTGSNRNITANFVRANCLTTNVNPTGGGSVSVSPNIGCGWSIGQPATLTATPSNGYKFTGWSGSAGGTANPLTYTMTGNATITANFELIPPPGVVLALSPSQVTTSPGSIFTVDINIAAGAQSVDTVETHIKFDPTYLQVVDANGAPADSIEEDLSALSTVLVNTVDNASGLIRYDAGKLSGTSPSGSFRVATIRFKALAKTANTAVSIKSASAAFFDGNALPTTFQDAAVEIVLGCFKGSVSVPGYGSLEGYSVLMSLFEPGSSTPIATYPAKLDPNGEFSVCGIASGVYDIEVKGEHSLGSLRANISLPSDTIVDFCTLLEGDASDDNQISAKDFSILRNAYGTQAGDPDFNARADFNGDGQVSAADFSRLRGNYSRSGPVSCSVMVAQDGKIGAQGSDVFYAGDSVTGDSIDPQDPPTPSSGTVNFKFDPDARTGNTGDIVDFDLVVEAGSQSVDTVALYIEFDPAMLQVVDSSGNPATEIEVDLGTLNTPLANSVDNTSGTIRYDAGKLTGEAASGTFRVASFRVKLIGGPGTITIRYVAPSDAFYQGDSVVGNRGVATVTIEATPTDTPTPTIAATHTPTSLPTDTPTPTVTATHTPTPLPTDTPTPTITPSHTPTLHPTNTPTITPTATVTPTVCRELVTNPGFEEDDDSWWFTKTATQGRITDEDAHTGARSALLGLSPDVQAQMAAQAREVNLLGELAPAGASYSTVYQTINIPADAETVTLDFWYKPGTEASGGDWQRVLLLEPSPSFKLIAELMQVLENDGTWKQTEFDLSDYRGQKLALYFEVYNNDIEAADRTWMFLDDVSVQACGTLDNLLYLPYYIN